MRCLQTVFHNVEELEPNKSPELSDGDVIKSGNYHLNLKLHFNVRFFLAHVSKTNVGNKRTVNENFGVADTPNGKVFVVCDSMGDPVGGVNTKLTVIN